MRTYICGVGKSEKKIVLGKMAAYLLSQSNVMSMYATSNEQK